MDIEKQFVVVPGIRSDRANFNATRVRVTVATIDNLEDTALVTDIGSNIPSLGTPIEIPNDVKLIQNNIVFIPNPF